MFINEHFLRKNEQKEYVEINCLYVLCIDNVDYSIYGIFYDNNKTNRVKSLRLVICMSCLLKKFGIREITKHYR